MAFSANIHAKGKWTQFEVMLWGPGAGSCIRIVLNDEESNYFDLNIHYGEEKNISQLVSMLKESVAKLGIIESKVDLSEAPGEENKKEE